MCPWLPPIRPSIARPRGSYARGAVRFRGRRCEAFSTRRPSPRATWCTTPPHALPRSSTACSTSTRRPAHRPCFGGRDRRLRSRRGPHRRLAARDPRPCRPPLGGALPAGEARRQARHRPRNHPRAGGLRQDLQRGHRVRARRLAVRPAVRRRRRLRARRIAAVALHVPGHTPGRHGLCDRRRRVRRRHDVHARLRHGPRRLPRRRRAPALPLDPAADARCPTRRALFLCHDYKAPGRDEFAWETTIGAERTATSTSMRA